MNLLDLHDAARDVFLAKAGSLQVIFTTRNVKVIFDIDDFSLGLHLFLGEFQRFNHKAKLTEDRVVFQGACLVQIIPQTFLLFLIDWKPANEGQWCVNSQKHVRISFGDFDGMSLIRHSD